VLWRIRQVGRAGRAFTRGRRGLDRRERAPYRRFVSRNGRSAQRNETDLAPRNASSAGSTLSSGVDLLDRAFAILFAFRAEDTPLSLSELSRRTGLYKSTLLRLAGALVHHRFLVRLEDGRFRLGSAPFVLASIYRSSLDLGDALLPLMRELNEELGGPSRSTSARGTTASACTG
jgi:AraC-like DNA-binding protein